MKKLNAFKKALKNSLFVYIISELKFPSCEMKHEHLSSGFERLKQLKQLRNREIKYYRHCLHYSWNSKIQYSTLEVRLPIQISRKELVSLYV